MEQLHLQNLPIYGSISVIGKSSSWYLIEIVVEVFLLKS